MANELTVPATFHNAVADPAFAQSSVQAGAIAEGITAAFPVLSIRGKVFRLKYRGQESNILNLDTGQPVQSLDVIIVNASPNISKIFYEQAFVEGQKEAPDCWSVNGLSPDAAAPKKQAKFCASCPQNQWGSRHVNGKAAKACQDNKRLAVVPAADPRNELYGGPMLMRIPPASLPGMSAYNALLQQYGQTFFSVITQLSFDFNTAHPVVLFRPIAPITGELAKTVVELQTHPQVVRMLTEGIEYAKAEDDSEAEHQQAQAQAPQPQMQQPPQPQAFTPAPQATAQPQTPPPAPSPLPSGIAMGAPQPAMFTPAPNQGQGVQSASMPPIPEFLQRRPAPGSPGVAFQTAAVQPQAQPEPQPQPQPAAATLGGAAPTIADLQAQLASMQQQLAEQAAKTASPRARKGKAPPSPAPTAVPASDPQQGQATAVTQPQPVTQGVAFGAPQAGAMAAAAQPAANGAAPGGGFDADQAAGLSLPAGMDADLDQLLKR